MSFKYTFKGCIVLTLRQCNKRANDRLAKGRINAGVFNLKYDDIVNIWNKQCGKCHHSGIPMKYDKNEWRLSIDRIDNDKGYTVDNIVLCCLEFNTRKTWTDTKINEMIDILEMQIQLNNTKSEDYIPCLQRLLTNSKASTKIREQ